MTPRSTVPVLDPRVSTPHRRAHLWSALQLGLNDLELSVARAGQIISGVGLLLSIYTAIFVSRDLGMLTTVMTVFSLWWFWGVRQALRQDILVGVLRWLSPLYEITMPALLTMTLVYSEGAEYALGSWVAPQLFVVFIGFSIFRLNVYLPILLGFVAAAEYLGVWYFFMRPGLVESTNLLHYPRIQVIRSISLILAGFGAAYATHQIRMVIQSANRAVRQRDLFGKYKLGKVIASGGMGSVVHATYCPEGGFEREVAVKLIHPHLASNPSFVKRFRDEARLCARLAHPNIVPALDFGVVDGQYFFAMDFVDGPTLTEVQRYTFEMDQQIPMSLISHVGREISKALHHAHNEALDGNGNVLHVVHRDVSPGNVMFHRSGRICVLDFGVARALGEASHEVTKTLVGKPSYMAPEQLKKDAVDARSDLFSLAVILWELVCNRSLFRRDHEGASMMAVVEDEIPLVTRFRPEVKKHWLDFFEKALQRDPNKRFQTAMALSGALERIQNIEGRGDAEAVSVLVAQVTEDHDELDLDPMTEEH